MYWTRSRLSGGKLGKRNFAKCKGYTNWYNKCCLHLLRFESFLTSNTNLGHSSQKKNMTIFSVKKSHSHWRGQRVKMNWHNKNEANSYSHERPNDMRIPLDWPSIFDSSSVRRKIRWKPQETDHCIPGQMFWRVSFGAQGFFDDFCARNFGKFCVWASQQNHQKSNGKTPQNPWTAWKKSTWNPSKWVHLTKEILALMECDG